MNGAEILDSAERALRKYTVQQSDEHYWALALWAAYTHAADAFQCAPRLIIQSAEKGSGKSRTLDIVTAMSYAPLPTANATTAAIFRSIDSDDGRPPTIALDEADTVFGTQKQAEQHEDLRAILNAGFQVGTPVLRTVGPTHKVEKFPVFAPALLAGLGNFPETITSRAVVIRLRRRKPGEQVSPYRMRRDEPSLRDIAEAFEEWLRPEADDYGALPDAEPASPLEDRPADVWEPLLAIADLAGGAWPERARKAAVVLTSAAAEEDVYQSPGLELLADIRQVIRFTTSDTISSEGLLRALQSMQDSDWGALSKKGLAARLRPYQINSTNVGPSGARVRGYKLEKFRDAFDRYLPDPGALEATG